MNPILVAGTAGWDDDKPITDWFTPGHPFGVMLTESGHPPTYDDTRPFIWSTDLAGVPFFTDKKDWAAGGAALAYFTMAKVKAPGAHTAVITHSHGLQVALYACALYGLKIGTLISVCGPVRKDMMKIAEVARPNIGYWIHVNAGGSDRIQLLGELFDGMFRFQRAHPLADLNCMVDHAGHSDLLKKAVWYPEWRTRGWLDRLVDPPDPTAPPVNPVLTLGDPDDRKTAPERPPEVRLVTP